EQELISHSSENKEKLVKVALIQNECSILNYGLIEHIEGVLQKEPKAHIYRAGVANHPVLLKVATVEPQ
ncbi:9422_t:CDS:2, partial [Dentiscutata erythropus]